VLAGVPSGPKAAAAAGHIGAASKAERAPVSAVDYLVIMDASERCACTLIGIAKDATGRQRSDITCATSARGSFCAA
jgi:hypothetical protein